MRAAATRLLLLQRRVGLLLSKPGALATPPTLHRLSCTRLLQQSRQQQRATALGSPAVAPAAATPTAGSRLPVEAFSLFKSASSAWQQQQRFLFSHLPTALFHSGRHDYLRNDSTNSSPRGSQGLYPSSSPFNDAEERLRRQHMLLQQQQQQQQRLLEELARQRESLQQQQQELLSLLQKAAERTLVSAAAAPARVLDLLLPSLQRRLLHAAAATTNEQTAASALLQRLSRDLSLLSSRGSSSSSNKPTEPPTNRRSSSSRESEDGDSNNTSTQGDTNDSNNLGGGGGLNRRPRNSREAAAAAAASSTRRVPIGFESFYPKETLKKAETGNTGGATGSNSGPTGSTNGRLPFMPPTGGALQHLLLRMCMWLGFWIFALSLLSRVVEPQLSLQVNHTYTPQAKIAAGDVASAFSLHCLLKLAI